MLTDLGVYEPGFELSFSWLNSSLPPSDLFSTQVVCGTNYGARSDYVNDTLEYDHGIDPATGCAMLPSSSAWLLYQCHLRTLGIMMKLATS